MKRLSLPLLVLGILAVAAPARAALFTLDSYDVALRDDDPGLVVWSEDLLAGPESFELDDVGDTHTTDLFRIGTDESALNWDDIIPFPISVTLNFTAPPPAFGGTTDGVTGAFWFKQTFGYVAWDNPLVLNFGNTGLLAISLSHETFSLPGSADVSATFKLVRADSGGGPIAVPEPASAMLVGLGLVVVAARRRQRPAA